MIRTSSNFLNRSLSSLSSLLSSSSLISNGSHSVDTNSFNTSQTSNNHLEFSLLISLPREIRQISICAYLEQKCIHSLRLVCRFLRREFSQLPLWKQSVPIQYLTEYISSLIKFGWEEDVNNIYRIYCNNPTVALSCMNSLKSLPPFIKEIYGISAEGSTARFFHLIPTSIERLYFFWNGILTSSFHPQEYLEFLQTHPKAIIRFMHDNPKKYYSLLYISCLCGHYELAKYLILSKKDVDQINEFNGSGNTPLNIAADRGKLEIVELLLQNGADPNLGHLDDGWTSLMHASCNGYKEIVSLLLEYGADQHLKNKRGNNAINFAKSNYRKDILELFKKTST